VDPQKKAPRGRTLQPNEETGHKKRIGFSFFIKEEKGLRPCLQKLGSILARISVYSLTSSTSNYVARSLHSTERRHELQETNQDSSSFQRQEKKQTTRNDSGSLVLSSLSETGPSVTFLYERIVHVQFEPADRGQDAKLEKTMYHYLEI